MAYVYTKKLRMSAERVLIMDAQGIGNLAYNVVACMKPNGSLLDACCQYANENVMVYTADRRNWFKRRGIETKNPDKDFVKLFGEAGYYAVAGYIKKHGLTIKKQGNWYSLVKTGPMIRKTTKRR